MGFNCLKATEPPCGGSLLFTTKFPEITGTHLIDLGMMKDWVDLEEWLLGHSQQKCPNSAYGSAEKKNMILSVWNIFFRDGYPSEQQKNTLCKHFMKFTKSKNNKHTGCY